MHQKASSLVSDQLMNSQPARVTIEGAEELSVLGARFCNIWTGSSLERKEKKNYAGGETPPT